ncbi:sensor histidine kinase [Streptomyces paludis]|uniref:sensor histidine kinase n=1 Tax=Streptomyces paludis TaxID=2282738 RepID=UPI001E504EC1|nr:histidine kinase [Streptomyces paludis]
MGTALVYDYRTARFGPYDADLIKLSLVLAAGAVVVVSPWLGARALPAVACAVGAASLGFTLAMYALDRVSPGFPYFHSPYGLAEPAALLWLLLVVPVRARREWTGWIAPPLLWTAIMLRPLALGLGGDRMITMVTMFAFGSTAVLGIGVTWRLVMTEQRRQASTLRLEQRTEFARDLHDFVAHHVTGIVVQAQGALAVAERRPELIPPSLERIERAGTEALTSMRHMVGMLRDTEGQPALAPLAGIDEIDALVEGFAGVGGARARLDREGTFGDLPVEVTTTAHRVVMEALTNIRKHAHGCTEVTVRVARSTAAETGTGGGSGSDILTVRVTDNGRPRHTVVGGVGGSGGGFGLRGLAERVGLIGGRIQAGPVTGGGWGVEAVLPVLSSSSVPSH